MASARLIKRRIKTASNISQITKAMEMVAASKMKRAQELVLLSRPYADRLFEVMTGLAARVSPEFESHPFLRRPGVEDKPPSKRGVLLIAPDKGLCGGLVSNLTRELLDLKEAKFIIVGKKGGELVRKLGGELIAEFELGVAQPQFDFVIPVARVIREEFLKGNFSRLLMVYTRFESTLLQRPYRRTLLPISVLAKPEAAGAAYLFEPSPREVLDSLLSHYLEISLYQVVLEAVASEHSARMVAMRNAHENAGEMVDELQLLFNRARQEQITEEITDVVTARMSLG